MTKTDAKIIPVENQRVFTPEQMQLTVAPVIAGQNTDENNPIHSESGRICFVVFAISDVVW
jgi:hypothetical protein